jgi:hypothetical protein
MEDLLDDDFQGEFTEQEQEALESASQSLFKAETVLASLESLKRRLVTAGKIDRTTASTIKTMTIGMESMERHFSTHPIKSYTTLPSTTNLTITLEGLLANIGRAIVNAIKAIIKFIKGLFTATKNRRKENNKKFDTVQKAMEKTLKGLSVTPTTTAAQETNLVRQMEAMSPFALWLGGRDVTVSMETTPVNFINTLYLVDQLLVKDLSDQAEAIEKAIYTRPIRADLLMATISPRSCKAQIGYYTQFGLDATLAPGAAYDKLFAQGHGKITAMNSGSAERLVDAEDVIRFLKTIETTNLYSATRKFTPDSDYNAVEQALSKIDAKINSMFGKSHHELDTAQVDALMATLKDVRSMVSALTMFESTVNQYRIATGAILKLAIAAR